MNGEAVTSIAAPDTVPTPGTSVATSPVSLGYLTTTLTPF